MILRALIFASLTSIAWCQPIEQAKRAFDNGDYATAARLFEQARLTSSSCDLLFYLGLAQYRMKQPDAALISFQSAVQCDPKLASAHLVLGEAYRERGNDGEALAAFTRVLKLEPKNPTALRAAAVLHLKTKANVQAIELLKTLIAVEPKSPDAHADLAAAYAASGDSDRAGEQYQAALRLQPDHASALMGYGNLYLRKGEEEHAIELLQKAAKYAPKAFEPHFLLGTAYNRLGRYPEAIAALQTAVQLGGNESEVYYHLARAYGGLGRPEDRARELARFMELTRKSKDDAEAQRRATRLIDEAKALVEGGSLLLAAARLEEAREARSSDHALLFRLASVNYDLQRNSSARHYAREAVALAPSEWLYHYLLGLIERRARNFPEARAGLATAAQLNPSAAEVQNALGELALQEGEPQRAVGFFQRAAQLDPKESAYRLNLEAARRAAAVK